MDGRYLSTIALVELLIQFARVSIWATLIGGVNRFRLTRLRVEVEMGLRVRNVLLGIMSLIEEILITTREGNILEILIHHLRLDCWRSRATSIT